MKEQESQYAKSIIWELVKIEESVMQLSSILAAQPLVERKTIDCLLSDIETIAINCRRSLVASQLQPNKKSTAIEQGIVTPKEIRELLEAFA